MSSITTIVAPDDDDKYDRVGSVVAQPVKTIFVHENPTIVAPENFSNYQFPYAHAWT